MGKTESGRVPSGQALGATPPEPVPVSAHPGNGPSRGFAIKRWCVAVEGYGNAHYELASRGKALAHAWACDAFGHLRFGDFLKIARCWRVHDLPERWGDRITVGGRPAFFIENNRQYVRFAYPGSDHVSNAHPYDVLPVEYRPNTYRDRDSDTRRQAETGTGSVRSAGSATPQGDRP